MKRTIICKDVDLSIPNESSFLQNYEIYYNRNVHQPMRNYRKIRYIRRVGSSNGINLGLLPVEPPVVPPEFVSKINVKKGPTMKTRFFSVVEEYGFINTNDFLYRVVENLKPHRSAPTIPTRSSSLQDVTIEDLLHQHPGSNKSQIILDNNHKESTSMKKSKSFAELLQDGFKKLKISKNKKNVIEPNYVGMNFVAPPNIFYGNQDDSDDEDFPPPPPPELFNE